MLNCVGVLWVDCFIWLSYVCAVCSMYQKAHHQYISTLNHTMPQLEDVKKCHETHVCCMSLMFVDRILRDICIVLLLILWHKQFVVNSSFMHVWWQSTCDWICCSLLEFCRLLTLSMIHVCCMSFMYDNSILRYVCIGFLLLPCHDSFAVYESLMDLWCQSTFVPIVFSLLKFCSCTHCQW